MAFDVGAAIAHIQADLSNFTQGIGQAKEEAASLGENITGTMDSIRGFAEQAGIAVGIQAAGLGLMGKEMVDVAASFEQTQTSFGTLLGSEQKAADLMKQLMDFEQHTPFDIGTLSDAAKQLLAMGVGMDQIIPHLKEFTDISQGSNEKLSQMASIYGQINSLQHVNGSEILRLARDIQMPILQELADHYNSLGGAVAAQTETVNANGEVVTKVSKNNADQLAAETTKLSEQNPQLKILEDEHVKAGFATEKHDAAIQKLKDSIAATTDKMKDHTLSLQSFSGQTKVTTADVEEMIKKGQVSVQDFDAVLKEVTSKGGLYFNENIRQMNTFNGIISSVRSQFQYVILNILGIDLGAANEVRKGGLFDTLKNLAADLLDWLHQLQPVFAELGKNKTFQLAVEGFVIALASLVVIIPVVIAAMNPIFLTVVAIEGAITLLYMAWNTNFLGIRDVTTAIIRGIVDFWNTYLFPALQVVEQQWAESWNRTKNLFAGVWYVIQGIVEVAVALIRGIIEVFLSAISGNTDATWKALTDLWNLGWQGVFHIIEGAIIILTNLGAQIFDSLMRPFNDAWNAIQSVMNKIKSALDFTQRHSPSVIDIIENGVQLANDALSKLAFNNQFDLNPSQAFSSAVDGRIMNNQIQISLDGAIIADSQSAQSMAEKIGDSLINKLKLNVRF